MLERDLNLLTRCKTLADYWQLIARVYGFYEPLEANLSALLDWGAVLFDFEQRRKTPLLVRDLQALGLSETERAALPRCHDRPALTGFGSALGCLYVLKGATLGGQIIARHFNTVFQLTPENGAAFYHSYGPETGPRWKEFGAFDWNIKTAEISWAKETEEAAAMTADKFDSSFEGFIKVVHPADREMLEQRINAALTDGDYECEFRMLKGDGGIRWVIAKGRVFFDDNGQPSRLVGVDIDITKRKLAEESLLENQRFTQSIIETAPSVLYLFDLKTKATTYLTERAALSLGFSSDEVKDALPNFLERYMHPEEAQAIEKHFQKISQSPNGEVFEFEYRMRHKSGEWRWFRSRDRVFKRDENGKAAEILGIALDITERKQAQDKLRESEARIRRILKQSPAGIVETDAAGRMVLVNPRWCEMFGYSEAEMLEISVIDITHQSSRAATLEAVGKLSKGGADFQIEKNYQRKDGSIMRANSNVSALRGANGEFQGLVAVVLDITERVEAEEKLNRQARLIGLSYEPIIVWSADAGILEWNAGAEQLYGYTKAEAVGKISHDLLKTIHPLPLKKLIATLERDSEWAGELRHTAKDGREVIIESRQQAVELNGQRLILETNRDITERKQSEAERERLLAQEQQARETAEAATRAKDEFLALVTHELRNPLNAILGYTRINRMNPHDAAQVARNSEIVERSARMQQQLIDDLLDTARIVSGKLKIEAAPIDLRLILEDALSVVRPAAEARQIELTARFIDDPQEVIGDAARLQQVALNLLQNAIKFTPESGRVELRVERAGHHLRLIVSDTGKGIEPDFLPYIFDRFSQTDTSSTRRHGGLGLGLALVKQLVELHGGTIAATSAGRDMGSTFTVSLPLRPVQIASSLQNAHAITEINHEAHRLELARLPRLTGVRVLVVDDQEEARMLVAATLQERGAQVTTAASGPEAVTLVEKTPFDVLVCDISMPEVDGYEVLRRIRAHETQRGLNMAQRLPAVALTALSRSEDRLRALSAGFQMHTAKPVEPAELIAVIASLIGSR